MVNTFVLSIWENHDSVQFPGASPLPHLTLRSTLANVISGSDAMVQPPPLLDILGVTPAAALYPRGSHD